MPAHIAFLYDNRWSASDGAISASSEASALPASASQNPDRSYVARSLVGTGTWTIERDLGSEQAVSALAVANVKLLGDGGLELYHRGDASTPGAAVLVATVPTQDRDTRAASVFFTEASHRHWQLKFTNPTAVNDYAEVGFVFLGTELVPDDQDAQLRSVITRVDPTVSAASLDGQETYALRNKYFTGQWILLDLTEAQLAPFRTMWDEIGTHTPLFMVLDADKSWTTWYARLSAEMEIVLGDFLGVYTSVSFPWREVR